MLHKDTVAHIAVSVLRIKKVLLLIVQRSANLVVMNYRKAPNKSLKWTAQTGAASQYCAGSVRCALRATLCPLALR